MIRGLSGFGSGCFVVDGGSHFVHELGWDIAHFVVGPRVLGDDHENFRFTVAAGNKIAVRADVSTTHGFWHRTS
jgi:hypothetical protein